MKRSMYVIGVLFMGIGLVAAVALGAHSDSKAGAVGFGAMFVAGGALFFWIGNWGVNDTSPLEQTELRRLGRPAHATVLEVEEPPFATDEAAEGIQVTLEVTPVNESAFRAKTRIARSRPTPRVGDQLRVKFDPNKRKHLIVMG